MTTEDFIKHFNKIHKRNTSSFLSGIMMMLSDFIALFFSIGLSFFIINLIMPSFINFRSFILYSYYFPLILIVYYVAGLYPAIMISPANEVKKLCTCTTLCILGIGISIALQEKSNLLLFTYNIIKDSTNKGILCAFLLAIVITTITMPASRGIARSFFGKTHFWRVPAVIYCTGSSGDEVISRLIKQTNLGYEPVAIINSENTEYTTFKDIPVFTDSDEILSAIKQLNIKVAIICDFKGKQQKISNFYRYTIYVSKNNYFAGNVQLRDLGGIIGFSTTHNLTRKTNLLIKRLIDLAMIIIFFPILMPVMLLISLLVKITSPGPVFFGHKRVGKNGREIKCWKFRSMYKNSQEMLEKILAEDPVRRTEWEKDRKFTDDPRVTKFGAFLRKTSLDELPQIFNIFCGSMTLVGPRPVTREEIEKYSENKDYILSVTPGLSGMWQISGRSDTGYEERINLDIYYIQNWSIWLDIWILIKTVWVVLKGKGAY